MQRYLRAIVLFMVLVPAAWLAGCGQKGELYLEDGEAAPSSQEAQAQTQEEDGEDDGD